MGGAGYRLLNRDRLHRRVAVERDDVAMISIKTPGGACRVGDTVEYQHYDKTKTMVVYGLADDAVFVHGHGKGVYRRISACRIKRVFRNERNDAADAENQKQWMAQACAIGGIQINDAADAIGIERGEMAARTIAERKKKP